jgi:hypothetical protein
LLLMRQRPILWVMGIIAAFAVFSWIGSREVRSEGRSVWEYKEVHSSAATLNELGAQGWELVTVTTPEHQSGAIYYLKRPK